MSRWKLKKYVGSWRHYISIIAGAFLVAVSINMLLEPNKIAPGGVSGIAIVLFHLFKFPIGTTMLVLNIPLFIIGIRHLGGAFGIKTLLATVMLSVIIDLIHFFPAITYDPLLASVYGGVIMGTGLALVFRSGATTGGTDLGAKIIHRFLPFITMGQLLLFVDFAVIIFAAVVFKNYEIALYAVITLFIASKVIDAILEGVNFAKGAFIISTKANHIAEKVITKLDRGVTGLYGQGMYTGKDRTVLMCVLHRREIPTLKIMVKEIDPQAFIILTDVREVLGEGFKVHE